MNKPIIYPNFFCNKVCQHDFSIIEWNQNFKMCNELGIYGENRDKILNPEFFPCDIQCNDCINMVLAHQIKKNI
jgi:hypothetical protein